MTQIAGDMEQLGYELFPPKKEVSLDAAANWPDILMEYDAIEVALRSHLLADDETLSLLNRLDRNNEVAGEFMIRFAEGLVETMRKSFLDDDWLDDVLE